MSLVGDIGVEVKDEIKANQSYRSLASRLRMAGYHNEGAIVDSIADDEERHANLLMTIANFIQSREPSTGIELSKYPQRSEPTLTDEIREAYERAKGTGKVTVSPFSEHRPFPKTYGDWVDLAESIKDKADIPVYTETSYKLGIILGNIDGDAEDAKRWLIKKAGELGIR